MCRFIPFPFRVGRRGDVSLSLAYPTVSSVHAELVETRPALVLRDLGSTNGTFVNGVRVIDENSPQRERPRAVRRSAVPGPSPVVRDGRQDRRNARLRLRACTRPIRSVDESPLGHSLLSTRGRPASGQTVGYEALGRSAVYGLEMPDAMFQAASQLDLQIELSRMFRWEAVRASSGLENPPHLFLNTHPAELDDPGPHRIAAGPAERQPAAADHARDSRVGRDRRFQDADLQAALNDLDMKWAYDDFGAGQDRLAQLVEVRPDFIKFDMGLIRGIDQASGARLAMLETLVKMVLDLGIVALAEGDRNRQRRCRLPADRLSARPRIPLRQTGAGQLLRGRVA